MLLNTVRICSTSIGWFVFSSGALVLGTRIELTNTSTRAGSTGCSGGSHEHICLITLPKNQYLNLKIVTLMGQKV